MHCKQRFAVVVQQVQANVLAQLGSNPFKPHPGALADPTTPPRRIPQKVGVDSKEKLCLVLLSKDSMDRVIGQRFPNKIKNYWDNFLPSPSMNLETLIMVLKQKAAFLRMSAPNPYFFKYQ